VQILCAAKLQHFGTEKIDASVAIAEMPLAPGFSGPLPHYLVNSLSCRVDSCALEEGNPRIPLLDSNISGARATLTSIELGGRVTSLAALMQRVICMHCQLHRHHGQRRREITIGIMM
jgi:hypothetical protein